MLPYLRSAIQVQYRWWLVAIGVVVMTLAGRGLISALLSTWTSNEFWDARPLTWLFSSTIGGSLLLLPAIGFAVDRFGPRPMMLGGLFICAAAGIASVLQPSPSVAAALFGALIVGTLIGTSAPILKSINEWFDTRKPLAIGALLFAVDALDFPMSLAAMGGRPAALVFGALVLVVALPLATLVRRPSQPSVHPKGEDLAPARPGVQQEAQNTVPEYTLVEALRSRQFWLLTMAAASLSAVDQLTRTLLFPIASYRFDLEGSYRQFEEPFGIIATVFVLVGGYMGVRMPLRRALLIFSVVHVVAVSTALVAFSPWWLLVATSILGAGRGGARALGIAAVGDYFGRNRFATLSGVNSLLVAVLALAYVSVPLWFTNWLENPAWALAGALVPALVGTAAYWKLGDPKPAPAQTARQSGD